MWGTEKLSHLKFGLFDEQDHAPTIQAMHNASLKDAFKSADSEGRLNLDSIGKICAKH